MEKKKLGNTDLHVAPLAFGGNVFGWTADKKTSFALLDEFAAKGFNLVDTADVYSKWAPGNKGGESETVIGEWMQLRKNRDNMIIATKVGGDMGDDKKGVSKKYILEAIDASLTRLKTDYVDLYQTHFDDEETPVEDTLEAYDILIKAGKVRWIGTSNMSPDRIRESLTASTKNNFPAYQTLQPHYNLYERKTYETEYEKLCLDNNIGVMNYFSLASGFLTGKYRTEADFEKSARGDQMGKYMNDRGFDILDELDLVSLDHNTTPATVAMAWLMARKSITAPIASATSLAQLDALLSSTELHLTEEEIKGLDEASDYTNPD
jgi:aryl-alcohol dehydrogenase-like predicted oxidoreductase